MADRKEFMVEDAELIFKNFAGSANQFNAQGDRNFAVILDADVAEEMLKDGWNIKYLKPREDDEDGVETPYIQVTLRFDVRPPRVVMLTSRARTHLDEASVETLDWADIETADLICTGYEWDVNGKQGIKPYVKSLFVTIREDYLEQKYAIMEDVESGEPTTVEDRD